MTKVKFLVKEQNVSIIYTEKMEYQDVLSYIYLFSRMSVTT